MYRLLLADDERIIREGIVNSIDWKILGIEIEQAKNGLEAYEKIIEHPPDIVITDIKMPGMDGLELIERIKEKFSDIIFIILSGYGEFDYAIRSMQSGVRYYLLKPCNEREVIEVLRKSIGDIEKRKEKEELLQSIKQRIEKALPKPDEIDYNLLIGRNDRLVQLILNYAEQYICDERLSLSWLAREVMYMNEDHLGKIFKNKTGENFSQYLFKKRMEKAKEIIAIIKDCRICDIAEMVGYGSNPQYFGQVFKKYTGYTPSEYKKSLD